VKDGKFLAVGTRAEVGAAAGKDARLDKTFNDKVVIAGFVEQHVHPALAALTMNTKVISIEDWDAIDGFSPAVRDEKGYEERLNKALAAHTDRSKPFVTWGYHHYFHGEMSRDKLNKLAPDFPVIVWHRSAHEVFLNDAALKLTGIASAEPRIVRSRRSGPWAGSSGPAEHTAQVRHMKGIDDLATLVTRANEEVHCLELVGGTTTSGGALPDIDTRARDE